MTSSSFSFWLPVLLGLREGFSLLLFFGFKELLTGVNSDVYFLAEESYKSVKYLPWRSMFRLGF